MALRIRYSYSAGSSLGYSVERLSDGYFYDFSDGTFKASPSTLVATLPADTGSFVGRYKVTLATSGVQFTDGDYCCTIHDTAAANAVVGELAVVMHSGDDATVFPSGAGTDPLSVAVPGTYAPGTVGYLVGANLNATVSSRSTYAGGAVTIASNGLDAVTIEGAINARQALALILAAEAGTLTGAGTTSITIKAAGGTATRLMATVDLAGDRTALTLTPPA